MNHEWHDPKIHYYQLKLDIAAAPLADPVSAAFAAQPVALITSDGTHLHLILNDGGKAISPETMHWLGGAVGTLLVEWKAATKGGGTP